MPASSRRSVAGVARQDVDDDVGVRRAAARARRRRARRRARAPGDAGRPRRRRTAPSRSSTAAPIDPWPRIRTRAAVQVAQVEVRPSRARACWRAATPRGLRVGEDRPEDPLGHRRVARAARAAQRHALGHVVDDPVDAGGARLDDLQRRAARRGPRDLPSSGTTNSTCVAVGRARRRPPATARSSSRRAGRPSPRGPATVRPRRSSGGEDARLGGCAAARAGRRPRRRGR